MPTAGIDKVTRLVGLFTLLLVAILVGGGWIFHGLLGRGFQAAGRDALFEQGSLLRAVLESHPEGPLAAWRGVDSEALRLAANLDALECLDAAGEPLPPTSDEWRLPAQHLSDGILAELQMGLSHEPAAAREGGEIYQSLYLPLGGPAGEVEGILRLETGSEVSLQLAELRRGLWIATWLGAVFVLFVLLAMAAILRQARGRQRELDRAEHLALVGTLAAGLAHEIRNPLAIIAGNAELIELGSGAAGERARAAEMLGEVERLQRLLEDFLHFARPQELRSETLPPLAFWKRIVDEQAALFPGLRFELSQAGEGDLPSVPFDPDRMRQVGINLLRNAAEAAGEGGSVSLRLAAVDGGLRISVCDSGPGVPESLRGKIFEPFVSAKEGGTGLGLAVCLSLARAHGGDLRLARSDAGGAEFVLTLPANRKQGV